MLSFQVKLLFQHIFALFINLCLLIHTFAQLWPTFRPTVLDSISRGSQAQYLCLTSVFCDHVGLITIMKSNLNQLLAKSSTWRCGLVIDAGKPLSQNFSWTWLALRLHILSLPHIYDLYVLLNLLWLIFKSDHLIAILLFLMHFLQLHNIIFALS